jgi:RNA polymerase sigma factor (sigma-70 family)
LGQLYDRHVPGIYDFLARFTRDPAAAEDLAHSTFLRAWERRDTLPDPSRVRAWLYATAQNLALSHLTSAHPADSTDDEASEAVADPTPEPEVAAVSRGRISDLVWTAALSLEPRKYAVLDLSSRRKLSTDEVADVLGLHLFEAVILVDRSREALGNAVRTLLVANRRDHCERLAALVPAGVQALTGEQRSAVDHHMRRCESCRELSGRLTAPAQVLGALPPLPLPSSLGAGGRDRLLAAVQTPPAVPAVVDPPPPPRWQRWEGRRRLVLGVLLLLLVAAGGSAAYVFRPSQPSLAERTDQRAPRVSVRPTGAVPASGATASRSSSGAPAASPRPGATTSGSLPQVVAAPGQAPSSPNSGPPPPFAVASITVTSGPCPHPQNSSYVCRFSISVTMVSANGRELVSGTLTATTSTGETRTVPFQVAVTPSGTGRVNVTASFSTCPIGVASATTVPASATPSNSAPFGAC